MRYVKNNGGYRRRSRRLRARRRALVTLLAAAALVWAIVALLHRPSHRAVVAVASSALPRASASALAPATAAPLARSPRGAPWTPAQRDSVRAAIENALERGIAGADTFSLLAVAHDGTVLYDNASSRAVAPASVEKLVVADAALADLGPGYRFQTLFAASALPQGGTISGDLWLVTSGDPSLRSHDVREGALALRSMGVQSVTGSVVVDGSALTGEEINPFWNAADANEDFMAATSGASIDDDTVEFDVRGTSAGEPADVSVYPRDAPVTYAGTVTTGDGDDVTVGGTNTPNDFRLSGTIPPGARERFWLPVHGMPQYLAAVAGGMLKDAGITFGASPRTGTVPLDTLILWRHRSAPLPQLLKHMLVESDNHYAEQLMRTLGARSGDAGDDANGTAQERAVLRAQFIPSGGLRLVDGSGLAHANRVSARTLTGILLLYDTAPQGNILYGLLPRGGKDGTLKRYQFNAAAGRVRAKSGHLADAASLAGYVDTRTHGRVAFAFMINGSPGDPDTAIIDAVDAIAAR